MSRLENKVALITGGEGSIGFATARAFVNEGARVVLAGIDADGVLDRAAELGDAVALGVPTDVTNSAQVASAVEAAIERFGKLDVTFANAGRSGPIAPIIAYPEDEFDRVIAVNVRGVFLTVKHSLVAMNRGASIVINSSVVGLTADAGIAGYATSKHAVVGLMRVAAKEGASRGIRVNTIHPGPVDNEFQHDIEVRAIGASREESERVFDGMIPLGRHAVADEVARAALFLASDESSFTTGAALVVDGGMSI
jgi:NAD(P)-dependent dehydrogenase (short-subunit alcohol dehydrogenase family)